MKKILKNAMVIMFALVLTLTTVTTASAHSPTDPANTNNFIVMQGNQSDGWWRGFLFEYGLYLPNDGPLFLADAVNNVDWKITSRARASVNAVFLNEANYRLLVITPDGSQVLHDENFQNESNLYANIYNLNPGSYRFLVFSDDEVFALSTYSISVTYY